MRSLHNSAKTSGIAGEREPLTVVLLEDNEEDAFLVRAAFAKSARYKAEIVHVKTVDAAVELCQRIGCGLVIADFWLGAENSLSFLRLIGGREAAVPVLLLTGMEGPEVAEKSFEAGALQFLCKRDLSRRSLDIAVSATLRTHRVEREMRETIEKQERAVRRLSHLVQEAGHDALSVPHQGIDHLAGEAEVEVSFERGDLVAAIDLALNDALLAMPNARYEIRFDRPSLPVRIDGDMAFLREAMTDVFAVLLRHAGEGRPLDLRLALQDGRALVAVEYKPLRADLAGSEDLFFANYIFRLHRGDLLLDGPAGHALIELPLRAGSLRLIG